MIRTSETQSIIDEQGRTFSPSPEGQKALESSGAAGTPITTPLQPGESYSTKVVFDLPANIRNPTLLINEGAWETHLIIGHENSPLHKKTSFQIDLLPAQVARFDNQILARPERTRR